jgi:hypothetical protein
VDKSFPSKQNNCLMTDHSDFFRKTFSFYDPDIHPFISGSFWMMRKKGQKRT